MKILCEFFLLLKKFCGFCGSSIMWMKIMIFIVMVILLCGSSIMWMKILCEFFLIPKLYYLSTSF